MGDGPPLCAVSCTLVCSTERITRHDGFATRPPVPLGYNGLARVRSAPSVRAVAEEPP
jgi:hypothetical protein